MDIKKKSALPVYGAALIWLIYCLFFPLYSWVHFLLPIILSIVGYLVMSKIFPGTVQHIDVQVEPVTTGDEKVDALMREGQAAIEQMKKLKISISNPGIKAKIDELINVTEKIFKDLLDDPSDYTQIKRFSNYYLPTTVKLLDSYGKMSSQGIDGENISSTLSRIDAILDTTIIAYKKQLDSLFADQALDIETDISVMESMLKREGLSGKDF